ncbi:MAG: TonB-dependent receptor plug domain-containing protein [Pleurocapsa sp. CRU_1_2]|nr:TonB-dependent receptor plug domain-containing protein [Pleurocapsa sp. CRU_1_2]
MEQTQAVANEAEAVLDKDSLTHKETGKQRVNTAADLILKDTAEFYELTLPTHIAQKTTEVTGVEIDRTAEGLELILETTAESDKLVPLILPEGKDLVIEVLDATLALPERNEFRQLNPIEGIEEVRVSQIDATSIRVTITGNERTPAAEIVPSSQNLVLSVSPQAKAQPEAAESIEVIVTADKREENVQDVPSSITVLGEQELEDARVNSLNDVAGNTPNLSLFSFGDSRYFNNYSIRGLSNFNFVSRDAAGFFVDDVPYDYGSFLDVDLLDLARVEVLRGPQSTLYGRNAQAGVVNIITRKPTNDFEFKTLASYGEFNALDFQASVNAPFS